jgi:HAD superfamily hydrolase (TIGR01549 family)
MSLILTIIIVITGFLALYWVFYGQRKYNEMMFPKRKTKLKAVLFDLDGVILDSFDAWLIVFNKVRKEHNLKEISPKEFRDKVWGGSVDDDARKYFRNSDVKKIERRYKVLFNENIHKTKLQPDLLKVIKAIRKKKIKVGIVTNTFSKPTSAALRHHKIYGLFDAVITPDDAERPKPYPDPVLKICEKMKIMPDEAILVGDTKNDYKAGKSAGCFMIGLNTHGDLVISKLSDLLELV